MGSIVAMHSRKPHVVINTGEAVHVVPVEVFRKLADGGLPLESLACHDVILRVIIGEWLEGLEP